MKSIPGYFFASLLLLQGCASPSTSSEPESNTLSDNSATTKVTLPNTSQNTPSAEQPSPVLNPKVSQPSKISESPSPFQFTPSPANTSPQPTSVEPPVNRVPTSTPGTTLDPAIKNCSLAQSQEPFSQPTVLIQTDFKQITDPKFGDDDTATDSWRHFGGDYFPSDAGVSLWNPSEGNLLESGLIKTVSLSDTSGLKYVSGDKVRAKVTVSPTFNAPESQTQISLNFDDGSQSVFKSAALTGDFAKTHTFYLESLIPPCATHVSLNLLGNLSANESSSLSFQEASLEILPQNTYKVRSLIDLPFDQGISNDFGENSPADIDGEFGFDSYLLEDSNPAYPGDKTVTVSRSEGTTEELGGLIKSANLGAYPAGTKISATLFAATTFTDKASESSFYIEFYDTQGNKLSTLNSSTITGKHHFTLEIEGLIPEGSAQIKVVPVVKLGATETSSLQWDDLKVNLLEKQ